MYEDYNNKSYSITAEQSKEVEFKQEKEFIVYYLRKALGMVGDMKISEAIERLEKELEPKFEPSILNLKLESKTVKCEELKGWTGWVEEDGTVVAKKVNTDSVDDRTKRFKKGDFIHNRDWICIYYGVKDNGAIQFFAFIPWDWDRNTSTERYDVRPTEKPKIGIGYINNETRLATEEEKTLLLTAIEYNGYEWDAEKLELKKKEPEFKPFDKVLVRDVISGVWMLAQYAFEDKGTEYKYNTVGGEYWQYCIPYEGNEHLLGTTENCE